MIDKIASAIATAEGFFSPDPNVLPRRNNNPGDLRVPGGGPIRKFATKEEGIAWLYFQIALDIRRGLTLQQLISKWAPPNENNTANYIAETARRTGLPLDVPLWKFLSLVKTP
jgi:hypothetical protein